MAKSEVSAVDLVSQQELCGLLARLNQRLDTHVRRVGEQLGITSSQVVALREMSEPMKLTELATRMACETSNAGYVIDRMAEQDTVSDSHAGCSLVSGHAVQQHGSALGAQTTNRVCGVGDHELQVRVVGWIVGVDQP